MDVPYACLITEENFQVIASEKPDFDLEETREWLRQHKSGYFLRDIHNKPFDCKYFEENVFHSFYAFAHHDTGDLFRRVVKL